MNQSDFSSDASGRLIKTQGGYWAFFPHRLNVKVDWDDELVGMLSAADQQVALLAGEGRALANPHLISGVLLRREAVLSSRIEGTQASLSDLFLLEAAPVDMPRTPDAHEVLNYVKALKLGLARLNELPVSGRLIKEIHGKLLEGVRGEHLTPGEFRTSQNWIGSPGCTLNEATFVPPPPAEMLDAITDLEKFINTSSNLPLLIKFAVVHYQFEAIHPFLDGNGRIGRLLLPLLLCADSFMQTPLLYFSSFFETHRQEYYDRLLAVSREGDWRGWYGFFLAAARAQAEDAIHRCLRLASLREEYRDLVQTLGKAAGIVKLVERLFETPFTTINAAKKLLDVSYPTAKKYLSYLVSQQILLEMGTHKREKLFVASKIMETIED